MFCFFRFSLTNLHLANIAALVYWLITRRPIGWIQNHIRIVAIIPMCMKYIDAVFVGYKTNSLVVIAGSLSIGMVVVLAVITELAQRQLQWHGRLGLLMDLGFLLMSYHADIPAVVYVCGAVFFIASCILRLTNHHLQRMQTLVFWYMAITIMVCSVIYTYNIKNFDLMYAKILFIQCYASMIFGHQPAIFMSIFAWFGLSSLATAYRNFL